MGTNSDVAMSFASLGLSLGVGKAISSAQNISHCNLESALVATGEHDVNSFGEAGGKWQTQMNEQGKPAEEKPKPAKAAG
jgi:hypothetical protein